MQVFGGRKHNDNDEVWRARDEDAMTERKCEDLKQKHKITNERELVWMEEKIKQ